MKVLVYNCKIGTGSLWSEVYSKWDKAEISPKEKFYNFEKEVAMPSIERWAKKNGYEYQNYTKSTTPRTGFFTGENDPIGYIVWEKLMRMYNPEYDYVIYLDTDIYVHERAGEFPIQKGLSICPEYDWETEPSHKIHYYDVYNADPHKCHYLNAGVFAIDRETAKEYFEWCLERLHKCEVQNTWIFDQDFANVWQIANRERVNYLDNKWNYDLRSIPEGETPSKDKNFYHFVHKTKEKYEQLFKDIV